jgi:hypothetical protein
VLVDSQQDTSGDYGYDLVHEAAGPPAKPEQPAGGARQEPRPADTRTESGGDLEYDEAHDF